MILAFLLVLLCGGLAAATLLFALCGAAHQADRARFLTQSEIVNRNS
jgi:hypothetical protein